MNSTNFGTNSKLWSHLSGGLNYQIEHHLFPHICHVHYRKLAKVVRETAQQFNIPYQVQPTFVHALIEHAKMLKKLGRA